MEGTKPYRRKNSPPATQEVKIPEAPKAAPVADLQPDAVNLERRAWFGSLVPAFGNGLVKLLRASNNLKDDLRELRGESSTEKKS
ncbi:MAG: hypothetical protein AB7K68_02025 [Bacteriovoracia bacterium]